MSEQKQPERGWGLPAGSRKWHWFESDGRSLCMRYGFYFGPKESGTKPSRDDCSACRKILNKNLKAGGER